MNVVCFLVNLPVKSSLSNDVTQVNHKHPRLYTYSPGLSRCNLLYVTYTLPGCHSDQVPYMRTHCVNYHLLMPSNTTQ